MSSVIATLDCPSISGTIFGCTSFVSSRVAQVCRRDSGAPGRPARVREAFGVLEVIKGANLLLRFLLELFAMGALGYWGFKTGNETIAKIGLGVGAPLVVAVVWGAFLSPRAAIALPGFLVLVLQALVFGSAAGGLVVTGHRTLDFVFVAVAVINALLVYAWGQ
jgi:hypothetical protein